MKNLNPSTNKDEGHTMMFLKYTTDFKLHCRNTNLAEEKT